MPLGSLAHINYWEGSVDLPDPPESRGGYPSWQGGVIAGSLFGGLQAWWEKLRDCWRLAVRLYGLTGEQRAVVNLTLEMTEHPDYVNARAAVRATAVTLGLNKPRAWVDLSHKLHERRDWAENSWRHLSAMQILDASRAEPLTNPQKNFLVELAYQGFALDPRGKRV